MNKINLILIVCCLLIISCNKKESSNENEKPIDELALLDAKIMKEPKDASLYYTRSRVLMEKGNSQEALVDILSAIDLDKKNPNFYVRKADILFSLGETTLAFSALQDGLKYDDKSSEIYLKSAELALYLRDYDKTMFNTDQVLLLDKINPKAYYLRGWALKEKGDTINAVAAYKKAIELNPEYEQPFEELGLLYAIKGDALAIDYLNSTININPKNTNAMYALALFYQEHGMIQKALDTYQNILTISPNNADALHNVGYINLVEKKSYQDAIILFSKAIEADSNYLEAYYNRGVTYQKIGETQKAKDDFNKVIQINPNHKLPTEPATGI
ncbi:MAG: tetratricopeptide repeat protein [Bacteroidales bacterium]|jgi:tetratricopeptide (TPR) repeat protein|nr:tetratricopeptide repeat protein [Bacteroidales bacterium]